MSPVTGPMFLDAAIPMYAAGKPHSYQFACAWIMTEVTARRLQVVIDTEILQEVLHRYASQRRFTDAVNMANELLTIVPQILPVSLADVQIAVNLFSQYATQGVPSRDLIHAAVMQNHGLTHIISPDAHFDRIAGITRLDPLVLHVQAGLPTP